MILSICASKIAKNTIFAPITENCGSTMTDKFPYLRPETLVLDIRIEPTLQSVTGTMNPVDWGDDDGE
jgi:hypothetical protein